jgi:mannose-6-phosphate isomerase-like protein (cupin superfamily)
MAETTYQVWSMEKTKNGPDRPEPTNGDPQTGGTLWQSWRMNRDDSIDVRYSRVGAWQRTGAHVHPDTNQYTAIVEGHALIWMDGDMLELGPGDIVLIPRNVLHNFGASADGDCWIVDLTSPPWEPDLMEFRPERDEEIADAFAKALSKSA